MHGRFVNQVQFYEHAPSVLSGTHQTHRSMKLQALLFLFLFVFACDALGAEPKPMNVVVLFADDWRHDTLGCAGNPVVKTPNLDQMAKEGVRFTHNCVTTSICGVSRATLLTGQWMSRHGNKAFDAFTTPWSETYPGLLRANGYYVGHVGKWHNGKFPNEKFDFGRSYSGTHWMKQKDGTKCWGLTIPSMSIISIIFTAERIFKKHVIKREHVPKVGSMIDYLNNCFVTNFKLENVSILLGFAWSCT